MAPAARASTVGSGAIRSSVEKASQFAACRPGNSAVDLRRAASNCDEGIEPRRTPSQISTDAGKPYVPGAGVEPRAQDVGR